MRILMLEAPCGNIWLEAYDDNQDLHSMVTGMDRQHDGRGVYSMTTYCNGDPDTGWDWSYAGGDGPYGYSKNGETLNAPGTIEDLEVLTCGVVIAEYDGKTTLLHADYMGVNGRRLFGLS